MCFGVGRAFPATLVPNTFQPSPRLGEPAPPPVYPSPGHPCTVAAPCSEPGFAAPVSATVLPADAVPVRGQRLARETGDFCWMLAGNVSRATARPAPCVSPSCRKLLGKDALVSTFIVD